MHLRPIAAAALALTLAAVPARAVAPTPPLPYLHFGQESAAYADGALGLLVNPATLGTRYSDDLVLAWSRRTSTDQINDELLSLGDFGVRLSRIKNVREIYGLAFAGGGEPLRLGWQPEWVVVHGARVLDHRAGLLTRPAPWLSMGYAVDHLFQPALLGQRFDRTHTLALGLRPLALDPAHAHDWGTRVTLTGDLVLAEDGVWSQARVRLGGEWEALPGIVLRGSVEDHGGYHLGLTLRAPQAALASAVQYAHGDPGLVSTALSIHSAEDLQALSGRGERRVMTIRAAGALGDESITGFSLFGGEARTSSAPLRGALERALQDPLTRGVLLDLRGVSGMAQIEELRPRIARLRAAGKPVVAWLEYGGGRGDLYLASACDRIVASPQAEFGALGLRVEKRYYRDLLERWGVRIDRSSTGAYKSAYREFSVDSTPPADRESIEHSLDVVQDLFVSAVTRDRGMDRARLDTLLDGRMWPPRELRKAGLIDSVGYREDALALLGRLSGLGPRPRTVTPARARPSRAAWTLPSPIAVVYASGGIDVGRSGNDLLMGPVMGSETMVDQIERAFRDRRVKAVVLRVESPGGSTLASDLIHHASERMKRETGKPLIVSMGGVAASGGYEISGPGDRIFADRFTVTGSIGVLYVKPSLEGWYARHDVRQEAFQRGDAMAAWSLGRDWDARMQAGADSVIREDYRGFVAQMAHDRRLSEAHVDSVAQGRVWYGEDARARGLVDEIGGLDQALAEARRLAHVPAGARIRPLEFHRPQPGLIQRLVGAQVRATLEQDARLPEPGERLRWEDLAAPW